MLCEGIWASHDASIENQEVNIWKLCQLRCDGFDTAQVCKIQVQEMDPALQGSLKFSL